MVGRQVYNVHLLHITSYYQYKCDVLWHLIRYGLHVLYHFESMYLGAICGV